MQLGWGAASRGPGRRAPGDGADVERLLDASAGERGLSSYLFIYFFLNWSGKPFGSIGDLIAPAFLKLGWLSQS